MERTDPLTSLNGGKISPNFKVSSMRLVKQVVKTRTLFNLGLGLIRPWCESANVISEFKSIELMIANNTRRGEYHDNRLNRLHGHGSWLTVSLITG
jgi:hypothetical protein